MIDVVMSEGRNGDGRPGDNGGMMGREKDGVVMHDG